MDNTIPSSQQRPTQQPVAQPGIPQTATDKIEDTKQQPANYTPNKEFAPMSSMSPREQGGQPEEDDEEDEIKVARQEVVTGMKVGPAHEVPVSQELKEFGIEQGADTEKDVPVIVQRAGVRFTSTDSAVPMSVTPSVKLPISYAHAVQLDKQSKIKESIKWLARFIKRQWEKVRVTEGEKPTL
jgi:hypothetical protein